MSGTRQCQEELFQEFYTHMRQLTEEQHRIAEEMSREIHEIRAEVNVFIARLDERCPQRQIEIAKIQAELAKQNAKVWQAIATQSEDTKERMLKQDERITSTENDKYKTKGFIAAACAMGAFASIVVTAISKFIF